MITVAERHQTRTREQRLAMTVDLFKPEPPARVKMMTIDPEYFHIFKGNGQWCGYPIDRTTSLILDTLIPMADRVVARVFNGSPHISLYFD